MTVRCPPLIWHDEQALQVTYLGGNGTGLDVNITPSLIAHHYTLSCRSEEADKLDMADITRIIMVRCGLTGHACLPPCMQWQLLC